MATRKTTAKPATKEAVTAATDGPEAVDETAKATTATAPREGTRARLKKAAPETEKESVSNENVSEKVARKQASAARVTYYQELRKRLEEGGYKTYKELREAEDK